MSSVIAFLGAIPEILALIKEFMTWINHVSGNDPQGFIKDVGLAFSKVNEAKTQEERTDAATAIAHLISRIP